MKKIISEQRIADGRRAAQSLTPPVALYASMVRPVIKRRLFEPGLTIQNRSDPIAALQHFARDLRIAGLVSADQADHLKAGEKQESAECDKGENVGGTAGAFLQDAVLFQGSIRSPGESYCTAAW